MATQTLSSPFQVPVSQIQTPLNQSTVSQSNANQYAPVGSQEQGAIMPGVNNTLPGTNTTTPQTSGARTLYDPTSGTNLNTALNSSFDTSDQYSGILDRYNQAQQATATNTQQTGSYISNQYGQNENYQKQQNNVEQQSELEGRTGFATSIAALTNLQAQGAQRVKQLTDQANQALMANNTQGAQALSDLAVQEQTALTTARTNFLTNYFAAQGEARSEASFQTPEQQQVMALASQYPDANIQPTDSQEQAEAKVKASPTYTATLQKAQQDVQTAQAQAALYTAQGLAIPDQVKAQLESAQAALSSAAAANVSAAAQSLQTRTLVDQVNGTGSGGHQADITALQNGTATPQQIQDKYSYLGQYSPAANIISQAQSGGYNLNQGTITGQAQAAQTAALNSGNLFNLGGLAAANIFNSARNLTGLGVSNPTTVNVISPTGVRGTIPVANLPNALKEGYQQFY